jgi:dsDNA-specific endonuclease/ATPase MutS2
MKAKTMKAKNQKLLRQFFNYLAKDGTVMNHSKEEAQQVLDQFIDHQDRKKKSKFGSDKEVVKLKEEPIQESSFKVGDKVEVVTQGEHGQLMFLKGELGLYNPISKEWYVEMALSGGHSWEPLENLKLLPND